ncbi:MAG: Mu transposase C-terminal domain-containing protein [Candidatus Binatus sp.]
MNGEYRAAVRRVIYLYAATAGVSVKLAIEIYNGGGIEIAPEVRAAVPRMSYRTMKRWSRAFKLKGLTGLMPAPGNRAGSGIMDLDSELRDFTIAMLAHNHLLSSKMIFDAMVKHFTDKRLPSCGRFRGWLKRWKLSHREHFERLSNPDSHRSKYLVSLGHQHSDLVRPFQVVQFDGTPANVLCSDGRYFLTLGVDIFTRRLFAVVSRTATAAAVLLCYRKVILEGSVPEVGVHDQGQEYLALRVQASLEGCGTISEPKLAHRPDLKGHIERAAGTLVTCCLMALPGYIGRNVSERVAIESRKSFAARLGKSEIWRFAVRLSAAELQHAIDKWIDEIYLNTPHAGLGNKTPNQVMREAVAAGWIARRLPERELDILLADIGRPRVVSKSGIHYDRGTFWHDALIPHIGKQVRLCLSDDLGQIFIFTADGEFICIARCPERANLSRRAMAIAGRAGQREFLREERKKDRTHARRYPRELLEATISNRATSGAPLMPVETADAPALEAAADAVRASSKKERGAMGGPRVISASDSDARWRRYERIRDTAPAVRSEDDEQFLRIYLWSPAFAARVKFGAVA